ncbi:MAG: hypothetical protein GQ528_08815 [Woeseiaceae bacterium]|nr:hypothetical protein [Woeseiaceae bacterium]
MKDADNFSKTDAALVLCCALLLLMNIGAFGGVGRRRAKAMVCLSNLHQWGGMFEMFTNDNDGYFNGGWDVGETDLWMNALRPYYNDDWNLLLCPAAVDVMNGSSDWDVSKAAWHTTDLPDGGEHRYVFSYSINSWTNNMHGDRGSRRQEWFWKSTRDVEGAGNIPVFADGTWHDAWPRYTDGPTPTPDAFGIGNKGTTGEMNHFCIDRHDGAVNILFMDWSVRKIGLRQLWTLKWHRQFNTAGPWTIAGGARSNEWPTWMRDFRGY